MVHFPTWFDGFGGISKDGIFSVPPKWVDTEKPPGHTSQVQELGLSKTLSQVLTLRHFFFSPNLVWFTMTAVVYFGVPYDMTAAARGFGIDWVGKRFAVNFSVALAYYGFFYVALYVKKLSQRKFQPGVYPTAGNIVHDVWYWTLGIVQWTVHECLMVRLWATGKVPYISDTELIRSPKLVLITFCWVLLIPMWRDLHFYFAHRFSHIRAFYKYVHSLHHRNTDPQPFSGLCMHPVEHLVYFSNACTPSLYMCLSPIIYMWNFMHLSIAPGAGHSGWEDHFQADQYHYIHHSKFECNYGSPSSAWIDQFFGTFREKLGSSTAYKGQFKEEEQKSDRKKVWSPQGYLGLQTLDHTAYTCFCLASVAILFWGTVMNQSSSAPVRDIAGIPVPLLVASLVAYGPVVFAMLLWAVFDKMSWRWPFQKESFFGAFGFFLVAGWASCLLPIYHLVQSSCTL